MKTCKLQENSARLVSVRQKIADNSRENFNVATCYDKIINGNEMIKNSFAEKEKSFYDGNANFWLRGNQ